MQSEQPDKAGANQRLASNKYFNPQELNNLSRVGKQPLPGMKSTIGNQRTGSAANRPKPTSTSTANGKAAMGPKRSLVVRGGGDLKKVEAPRTIAQAESAANFDGVENNPWDDKLGMNSSVQSFYSEKQAQIDEAQQ